VTAPGTATAVVAIALAAGFVALSALHVYWALGGARGGAAAIPEVRGEPAFRPGRGATLVVASLLALAAVVVVARAHLVPVPGAPPWLVTLAAWVLTLVLAGRVVGDLRTFGLFKRVRGTRFARRDSLVYTPLCIALAAGCLAIALGA
jgi:hypothetical protein